VLFLTKDSTTTKTTLYGVNEKLHGKGLGHNKVAAKDLNKYSCYGTLVAV
jgi:hypothetical protein